MTAEKTTTTTGVVTVADKDVPEYAKGTGGKIVIGFEVVAAAVAVCPSTIWYPALLDTYVVGLGLFAFRFNWKLLVWTWDIYAAASSTELTQNVTVMT